jgi:hypothetical protein
MTAKLMAPPLIIMLIVFSLIALTVSSGGTLQTVFAQSFENDGDSEAELEEQEVDNESTTIQDSSSDDNAQENDNDFGDDITAIGQDNEADQDAANLGLQDQEATQELEQEQDAANLNVDSDVQLGEQIEQQPPLPPEEEPPGPQCPSGFTFNADTGLCEGTETAPLECPSGFTLVGDSSLCVEIQDPPFHSGLQDEFPAEIPAICPPGFTWNPATNQCERTVTRPPT